MSSASRGLANREGLESLLVKMGPQTFLPAAHGVALQAGPYIPSSPTSIQDPREGPSLARRTTQDLLGSGFTKLAREGQRDQGKANLARFQ